MHLVIFESAGWPSLAPLTLSRPTFALKCGIDTLLEKQVRALRPTRLTLWVRPALADSCRRLLPSLALPISPRINEPRINEPHINEPLDGESAMLVDGSSLWLPSANAGEDHAAAPGIAVCDGVDGAGPRILHAVVKAPGLVPADALHSSERWTSLMNLPHREPMAKPISYLWDLLGEHEQAMLSDIAVRRAVAGDKPALLPDGPWHFVNRDHVLMGEGAMLSPGCVIDASKGPVLLDRGSLVGANAVVQGPCYLGERSEISPLAVIRPGTSIGPNCKIGGEVARAIVMANSNKAHDGFLGDSYLGEWVNMGAGTTTSNLKNTYGGIGMQMGGEAIDTGRQFLGSLIGDHSKTAIGTRFMSGSYVGYCAMLATSAHAPRFTPSFSFSTDKGAESYRMEKAFEVAKVMFGRRKRRWTPDDESLMRYAADAAKQAETGRKSPPMR